MATIQITPMNCGIDRRPTTPLSHNLRGAWALEEYAKQTAFEPGKVGPAFERVFRDVMLTQYMRERGLGAGDEINVVVTIKL